MAAAKRITYVVSFPKSGRSWLELMVASYYSQLTGRSLLEVIKDYSTKRPRRSKWLRRPLPITYFSHGKNNVAIAQGRANPEQDYKDKAVLFLGRDPRDVIVSHYYYLRFHYGVFEGSLDEFVYAEPSGNNELLGRVGLSAIINYMNAWARAKETFLSWKVVLYEDIKMQPKTELERCLKYVGLEIYEEMLSNAVACGSIENMRKLEQDPSFDWHGLKGASDPRGLKVRRGEVGGGRAALAEETLNYVESRLNRELDGVYERYKSMNNQNDVV